MLAIGFQSEAATTSSSVSGRPPTISMVQAGAVPLTTVTGMLVFRRLVHPYILVQVLANGLWKRVTRMISCLKTLLQRGRCAHTSLAFTCTACS